MIPDRDLFCDSLQRRIIALSALLISETSSICYENNEAMNRLIITIDGPAGTGKSTAARRLAQQLNIPFLDSGAMYRAVAWRCLQCGLAVEEEIPAAEQAKAIRFDFSENQLCIDGKTPGEELRSQEISEAASQVATHQAVRDVLVDQQRKLARTHSLVTEGRDQGTIVFPEAQWKFFLTASAEVRARRRWQELQKKNSRITMAEVLREVEQRDTRDRNRKAAPLKPASDAVIIDNSHMSLEAVVDFLVDCVKNKTESQTPIPFH